MTASDKSIAVIGAGAGGLMAAITAASLGRRVRLFDRMDKVGLKMGITGKGRCNLTNAAPIVEFIEKTPGNGRFLYSAYDQYDNEDLLKDLHAWGLVTKVERGGRVFPASDSAQEVRRLFMHLLEKYHVELHLSEPAEQLIIKGGAISGVMTDKKTYPAGSVILATGGKSYPRTGSTGDGYRMAKAAGHTIISPRPALVPLVCDGTMCQALQGLPLKNVTLRVSAGGRRKAEEFGEMLFTHFGITGPVVLSLSDKVSLWLTQGHEVAGEIDLKPALDEGTLDRRLVRDFTKFHARKMSGAMEELLPRRLIEAVLEAAGIEKDSAAAELTKAKRLALVHTLKHLPLVITGTRPIEEAIVTAGGVSTKEIHSATMESKLVRRLYFAGEVMDIHGFTGGYNLQAAFSTGHVAAVSAAGEQE